MQEPIEQLTKNHTADLHCHLNGSFSFEFLKRIAKKNNCLKVYEELVALNQLYLSQTKTQPEEGYSKQLMNLAWKQFDLIHQIIQNLDDITEGTIDVVESSKADYLEIRTTPKAVGEGTTDQYIDAFIKGLLHANQNTAKKEAIGLLSLDRTINTVDDAIHLVDRVLSSPGQVLKGLDISGNPLGKRTLTGPDLKKVVLDALSKGVKIAIHMGESDTEIEKQDTNIILDALEEWTNTHHEKDNTFFHGKVRLGHCIYLTEQQKTRIKELNVPIEVCPTCHSKLNWHFENKPHPIRSIYSDVSQPIVMGTDDEVIFGASAKTEFSNFLRFFSNENKLERKEIKAHQATFRF